MVERRTLRGSSFLRWKGRKNRNHFFSSRVLRHYVLIMRRLWCFCMLLPTHPLTYHKYCTYVRTVHHTIYYIVDVIVVSGFAKGANWCSEMGLVLSKPFGRLLKIFEKNKNFCLYLHLVGSFKYMFANFYFKNRRN